MTTLTLAPDGEDVVAKYLHEHADVTALGARISYRTPGSMTAPWVRVTQLNAPKTLNSTPEHLLHFLLQIDCFAGTEAMDAHTGRAEASLLARTVRAALDVMPDQSFDTVVVTDTTIVSMPRIPDTDFEPARERFVITAQVRMHAKPGA